VIIHIKAPTIFDYDDEGFAFVILDNNEGTAIVPDEYEDDLLDAVYGCPTESIKVADKSFAR
jgi:ferredoxin